MADIKLNISGDTRKLETDIQKAVGKAYTIDLKTKGSQPLGRITSQVSEFNKSLEASNARVLAFGASAGVIYGLESAFRSIVGTTIEVQKALTDINVILNVSASEIAKFGGQLFDIAKNTGQSFQEVAAAATEFSRQGLGVEETLKRTSEALILSRLSGLDAAKSVDALTASVNSFASQGVTTTEIINKFANVDAAFAVSSADLAEAISRVGSSAAQSGVNLNELIAIVTSAQQTTARGGSVIGNSFKTIFTRLQRGDVIDLLESLGVSSVDATGQLKSTIQLLQDLANVYDNLGTLQQADVAEKVGGVFQINILKAALADLGKNYSIYNQALNTANNSTDQAIQRNQELNKTYAAQLNALRENAAQIAATAGERVVGPAFERVVGGANLILGGINESDGQGVGATLAKGILDGLGQVIAGPGLALIGGVLIKLFKDFSVYASGSVKEVLGLNNASKQQAEIQKSINAILAQNPQLLAAMQQGTTGINAVAAQLLQNFKLQTSELQKQDALTSKIASQLYSKGVRVQSGVPTATKAEGFIPAFAKESKDIKRGVGGAKPSDKPLGPFNINGEPTVINSGEKLVPNFKGSGETAVLTRDMQKYMSMADGYIPNFANFTYLESKRPSDLKKIIDSKKTSPEERLQAQRVLASKTSTKQEGNLPVIDLGKTSSISLIYGKQSGPKDVNSIFEYPAKSGQKYKLGFKSSGFNTSIAIKPEDTELENILGQQVVDFTNRYTEFFSGGAGGAVKINSPSELANWGAFRALAGSTFETAVTNATKSVVSQADRTGGASALVDFVNPNSELRSLFNNIPGDYEAKISEAQNLVNDTGRKALQGGYVKAPKSKTKVQTGAEGYIPNFASKAVIQEIEKRVKNPNIKQKLKEGSGLKDEAYIKAASRLGVDVSGLEALLPQMGFPLRGKDKVLNLSKALGFGFGRSFIVDAVKLGDWNYAQKSFESAGYTKDEFDKLSKFAKTQKGENAMRWWKSRAEGYIPNFADPLNESINRELDQSGLPKSQVYVAQKDALVNPSNPMGLGVFNRRDEGSKVSEDKAIKRRASGYIPNFAEQSPIEESVSGIVPTLAALGSELLLFSFTLNSSKDQYKQSINQIVEANRQQSRAAIQSAKDMLKAAKDVGTGVRTQSGLFLKAQETIRRASAPSVGQKVTAGLGSFGSSLSFLGPVIAETISNAIPQTNKTGRVAAAATSGLGQIAGFAGTGALIGSALPGPGTAIGAGIGALAGTLLTVNSVFKELATDLPELAAAAQKATQELSKTRDSSSSLLSAFEAYQNALLAGDQDIIAKTQAQFTQTLSFASEEQKAAIQGAVSLDAAQKALAAILEEKAKKEAEALVGVSVADTNLVKKTGLTQNAENSYAGSRFETRATQPTYEIDSKSASVIGDAIGSYIKLQNLSPDQITSMKLPEGLNADQLSSSIQGLKLPEPIKQKLINTDRPDLAIQFLNKTLDDLAAQGTATANALNKIKQNPFPKIVQNLNSAFSEIASTLQKNINAISSFASFREDITNTQNQFSREMQIGQGASMRRNVAETITGADSTLSLTTAIQESLAKIENTRQSTLETSVSGLRTSIVDTLSQSFGDAIGAPKQGEKPSPLSPQSISSIADPNAYLNAGNQLLGKFTSASETINQKILDTISQVGVDQETGLINESAITNALTPVIEGLGISDVNGTLSQILPFVQKTNENILKGNKTAENAKEVLAKESTQKLTLQQISKAGAAFGGPSGFLDKESGPKAFDSIKTSVDAINQIQGGIEYRYGNRESIAKRRETMPDLGRGYLSLITGLKDLSGGLYTPTGKEAGYQTAVSGRQIDIENQLKQYKDLLKTPELRDKQNQGTAQIIKDAIASIESFGTKRIAEVQTGMATGGMSFGSLDKIMQETLAKSTSSIAKMSPELAPYLNESIVGTDPVQTALNTLNVTQAQAYNKLAEIATALANAPGEVALANDKNAALPTAATTTINTLPQLGLDGLKSQVQDLFSKTFGEIPDFNKTYTEGVKTSLSMTQAPGAKTLEYNPGGELSSSQDFDRFIKALENMPRVDGSPNKILDQPTVNGPMIDYNSEQNNKLISAITDFSNKVTNLNIQQPTVSAQTTQPAGAQQPANISTNVTMGGINITTNASEDVIAKFDAEVSDIRSQLQAVVSKMELKFPPTTPRNTA